MGSAHRSFTVCVRVGYGMRVLVARRTARPPESERASSGGSWGGAVSEDEE